MNEALPVGPDDGRRALRVVKPPVNASSVGGRLMIPPELQPEVDRILARALHQQAETLTLDNLKKELDRMSQSIDSANHLKRTLGRQLSDLSKLLRGHVQLPMHPGTAEALGELKLAQDKLGLRLPELTDEQQRVLPEVLRDAVATQAKHEAEKRDAQSRERQWQQAAAISMVLTVVVSLLAAMGVFSWIRAVVFHVGS